MEEPASETERRPPVKHVVALCCIHPVDSAATDKDESGLAPTADCRDWPHLLTKVKCREAHRIRSHLCKRVTKSHFTYVIHMLIYVHGEKYGRKVAGYEYWLP